MPLPDREDEAVVRAETVDGKSNGQGKLVTWLAVGSVNGVEK